MNSADTDYGEDFGSVFRAVRAILRVKEGESVLDRARTVMRRYDDMRKQLSKLFPDES